MRAHAPVRTAGGDRPISVAVTGLNATDNPGPGVGVLRSLRAANAGYHLVGLAYDALDPGVYAADVADEVYMIPYPSKGIPALLDRLEYIQQNTPIDVLIPTLDAELPSFIGLRDHLHTMGIRCVLPTAEQLESRAKTRLSELSRASGLSVPREHIVATAADLHQAHKQVPYPFYVKGPFYGATLVRSLDDALAAYHKTVATWGPPVVIQEHVAGEEYNVIALGDGRGGLLGAVGMKKMLLTDKGKGWAGITVQDPGLMTLATKFMANTCWAGGCEIEVIRDKRGLHQVIEINPRFPAWVHLSTLAGVNLPDMLVRTALGEPVAPSLHYKTGTMFVRISLDQHVDIADFQQFVTAGELSRVALPGQPNLTGAA